MKGVKVPPPPFVVRNVPFSNRGTSIVKSYICKIRERRGGAKHYYIIHSPYFPSASFYLSLSLTLSLWSETQNKCFAQCISQFNSIAMKKLETLGSKTRVGGGV